MTSFGDRPIKQKLFIATLVTTATALLLAGFGTVTADSLLFRGYLRRDLSVLARVIVHNSAAALTFHDPAAAGQALAALGERSHITGACIYQYNDANAPPLFAQYGPAGYRCPTTEPAPSLPLAIFEPIVLDSRQLGTLVLQYDLDELNERIRIYGSTIAVVFLAAALLAFLLSNRLRSNITTPIARLVSATTTVETTGDYSVRAEKLSGDELGVLVDRFNSMLSGIESRDADLKQALRDVEQERARFHFMAESMPQKIFTASAEGEVDYFNGQWIEYTGLSFAEIKGWGWLTFVHPDDRAENIRLWQNAVQKGEPFTFEQRFRNVNGEYRWHLSRAHALRDEQGRITMWIGSNTDIHEQKLKEEELRRANDDLQQFAYSASHDLQEPIRNVAVFSEIIARRYANVLDAEGQQFLGFLKEGGGRLASLVNDLLAYTHATMDDLNAQPTDSTLVFQEVLITLAEPIRSSGAIVTADELGTVNMGALHLQQIFQNLVGNALKYRSTEPPRIHVSVQQEPDATTFAVQDNGIGIDPQYKEKIFGIFKRLTHDRTSAGNGIGLAICQRVVERYNGRIWVESELGKGAVFRFSIPKHGATVSRPPVSAADRRGQPA